MKSYNLNGFDLFVVSLGLIAGMMMNGGQAAWAQNGAKAGTQVMHIVIATAHSALSLYVNPEGRLCEAGYGATAAQPRISRRKEINEFYPGAGNGYLFEPAVRVVHADGNSSLDLFFWNTEEKIIDENITLTKIQLKDPEYPFEVVLCFKAYQREDIIEQWTEITHQEAGPVVLYQFASASQLLPAEERGYYLTQFTGKYGQEARMVEEKLTPNLKIIDSKLGVRAHFYNNPSFILSSGGPAGEDSGNVIGGQLAWSGSFQLAFEVIPESGALRINAGMNPYASQYRLAAGERFVTPALLWGFSGSGKGQLSRNFHDWGRKYGLRDGDKERAVLLNNWEATYFAFDEKKLVGLFDGAKEVGLEMFLLDDGWFGNKYPRNGDKGGLGDWQVNVKKLPHGVSFLADEAKKRGLRFGIWVEPEMVNPKSELFDKHPDWAILQPKRAPIMHRNQMVLDLTRPEVREFVFKCVDDLLTQNPGVSYIKWDCNSYLNQPGSPFLKPDEQSHLWIDYVWALYDVMDRVAKKHPAVEMMLCSGGGGRVDYGSLRYFHEFWPSDKTDPVERIKIQWGYSQFFPAVATANHVTRMGKRPLKFTFDVAMSGRMGMDVDLGKFTAEEKKVTAGSIATYKKIRDVVLQGDLYRLSETCDGGQVALAYASKDRGRAVLFVYNVKDDTSAEKAALKNLQWLDPDKKYKVEEINLVEGTKSELKISGKTVEGAALQAQGIELPWKRAYESAVIEFTAQ